MQQTRRIREGGGETDRETQKEDEQTDRDMRQTHIRKERDIKPLGQWRERERERERERNNMKIQTTWISGGHPSWKEPSLPDLLTTYLPQAAQPDTLNLSDRSFHSTNCSPQFESLFELQAQQVMASTAKKKNQDLSLIKILTYFNLNHIDGLKNTSHIFLQFLIYVLYFVFRCQKPHVTIKINPGSRKLI